MSYVEEKIDHITILHDIVLAFGSQLARLSNGLLVRVLLEITHEIALGTDEPSLEVAMNHAGGLGGRIAPSDRPCTDLLGPCGELALQPQKTVRTASDLRQRWLIHPQ